MRHRPPSLLRTTSARWLAGACLAGTLAAHPVAAHGPVHAEIASLTGEIDACPTDAALHMERAELWRLDGAFDRAAADLDRAFLLDPAIARIDLLRGALALDRGDPALADACLSRYLSRVPGDAVARVRRARAWVALGRPAAACTDLDRVIGASERPSPDLVLERATLQVQMGRREQALAGIDRVLAMTGPLVSLERAALDLERALGRTDMALARLARLAPPADPAAAAERAEILAEAGRMLEARAELSDALAALESGARTPRAHPSLAWAAALREQLARLDRAGHP